MAVDKELKREVAKHWGAGRHIWLGIFTLVLMVGGIGGWSAFANIAGAVVSIGQLKVETNRQVVQHLEGGVVTELLVKEGDRVSAGDVLMRLDGKLLRGELAIVEGQFFEVLARSARLKAVRDDVAQPGFPDELLSAASDPSIQSLIDGQLRLHQARKDTVRSETEQLRERQSQIREEIDGSRAQQEALELQISFILQELEVQQDLLKKGLTQAGRVLALERESARLKGERGTQVANIARLKGQISEIEIQIIGARSTRVEEAISQLRDLEVNESELRERRSSLLETLDQLEIRAPRPGVVIGLTVHALRSVVRAAEPILYVVPSDVKLVIETKIQANNVDQVYPGQEARLRFSAFSARTTPDVAGKVEKISPDVFQDENTGASYYTAQLTFTKEGLKALGDVELVAGMPVEAYIQTNTRTPFSYFVKPLTDYFNKALREE
ncbi:MAG: HlyD family type I secretion periplasmic adaptor subunit [Pikeienuella sp.]